jgi:riboflavin synthase
MFTGIIEAVGRVAAIESGSRSVRLTIAAGPVAEDVALGDSVAINGVCLTVVEMRPPQLSFEAVWETLRKTGLERLRVGDPVNLERAVALGQRLGGHLVQGHVDGVGTIASIRPVGDSWWVWVEVSPELMRYIVTKGSVAIDGISLTVADSAERTFAVSIIPHTWENTTLKDRRAGDTVNVETDIIGKYVEKMLGGYISQGGELSVRHEGVTMDLLARAGYVATTTAESETERW